MSILVTGASGFVGGALARRLVAEGARVHAFVRPSADRWRLADLVGVTEHPVDLTDAAAVTAAVRAIRPRIVYHCAVYGGFAFQTESDAIFATNLDGTRHLLQACREVGFARFIATGSSSEYGPKSTAIAEDALPEPLGDYAVAKCAATLHCCSEARLHRLPLTVLRLFSPYGPWDDPRRFIPSACRTLLAGETLQLATPRAVRDYLYIDDLLDLYRRASEVDLAPGEIFNAGSGRQVNIATVATELVRLTGGAPVVAGPEAPRRPEPTAWVADLAKVERLLGWRPQTSLSDGLQRYLDWLRHRAH